MKVRIYKSIEGEKCACAIRAGKVWYSYLCNDGKIRTPMRGIEDWFDSLPLLLAGLNAYLAKTRKKITAITIE